ncbi:hypothetical protein ACPPVU_03815 [Mucilaginibacter sp. McL0603]
MKTKILLVSSMRFALTTLSASAYQQDSLSTAKVKPSSPKNVNKIHGQGI